MQSAYASPRWRHLDSGRRGHDHPQVVDELPGIAVSLRDADTIDDLGACHAPLPVEPGDLVSLEHGPPLRVVVVLVPAPGAKAVPALARTEQPTLADR
jgi:hypothetical protein